MQPYLCDFLYEYALSVGDKGGEVAPCSRRFVISSSTLVLLRSRMFSNIDVCGGKIRFEVGGGDTANGLGSS